MPHSLRRPAAALALALAACAKQQPLPVANVAGVQDDALTVASGQQIVLDATSSTDPSGTGLSFQWSFVSLPAGSKAQIESPRNAITRFTADVPTTVTEKYVLSLTVKNAYFVSAPRRITITALECGVNPPSVDSITAAPTSINIATPVLLTAAVTDKDNDASCQPSLGNRKQTGTWRWSFTSLPAGSKAALRDPAAEKAAFDPDVAGTYTVALTVTDSTGRSSAPAHLDVQVAACGGAAPGINLIASFPASPNLAQPTQLTADVTDADNNPVCGLKQGFSYSWSVAALPRGSAAQLNDPTAVNPSFTPDVSGEYRFSLVVTDSTGRSSAPQAFSVIVKDCGGAPPTPIVQLAPAAAGIGQPVSLKVTPQDADAACGIPETFSYAWSLVSVPGGSRARIAGANASAASLVPDVGGDYAVNVTITDSRGSSASAVSHLSVAPCGNNPPSVDLLTGLPLTPLVGQDVHVTAQVSDPDSSCAGFAPAQTFRWTLSMRPAGSGAAVKDPTARAADFVPDAIGHYQLSLVVTDATGLSSAPALFDVQTSSCGTSTPQVASVGASNPAPDPGTPFTLFAQAVDADNGVSCNLAQAVSLLWDVASRPAGSGATLSDPAAASPSFTADVAGSYQLSVVATDSTGRRSAPAFLTLTTTTCGTAIPTVTATPASVTVQPFQAVNLAATPFDADTACGINQTFTYDWAIASAPAGSSAMLSNPGAAAPTFVPDMAGSWLLSVRVSDGRGHVSPEAFVTVSATGCATLPPTAGALRSNPISPALGSPVALSAPSAQAIACFAAGASTALQYAWTLSTPAGSASLLDNPASPTPRFTPDVAGLYQAALVVRDSHGLESVPSVLNLNAAPCGTSNLAWNPAPELSPAFIEPDGSALAATLAGAVWTGAFSGTSVTMSAGFSDPPGCGAVAVQPFTYQWALVSQPAGSAARLDSASAARPVFVPDLPGVYQVAARVSDALGAVLPTRFASISVASCGSNLPVVSIAPPASTTLNTFQGLPLQVLGGTATDADNTACPARFAVGGFTYAWSVSPAGAALSSVTGTSTSFSASAPGTYTVQLAATASNGLRSVPATQVLTVGACGSHAPAISKVTTTAGGSAASLPQVGQTVSVTAFATDPDIGVCGDAIASYDWSISSLPAGSAATLSSSSAGTVSFTADLAGAYLLTVVATDSFGLRSAPHTVTVQTGACAPVASITPSAAAPAIGQAISLSATATDACVLNPSFSYAWRIASAPRGSAAPLSSVSGATVGFSADLTGAYAFEVIATDQAGFSSAPALLQLSAGTCGSNPPSLGAVATAPANGTFNAGERVTLSSALTDNNAGCGALTQPYRWAWTLLSRPAGSAATLPATDASPIFVPDLPGSYQVAAQVTDALGNVSAAVFGTVTTSSCGTAAPAITAFTASQVLPSLNTSVGPVASFTIVRGTGTAQNAGVPFYPNQPVALSATVSDADAACGLSQAVSYAWSLARAPAGSVASILNPSSATPSLVPDVPGEYDVQLVVTDSTGRSGAAVFGTMPASAIPFVPVGDCGEQAPAPKIGLTAPVVAAGPIAVQSLPLGSQVVLDASGSSDADNEPLQLTSASVPSGSAPAISGCGLTETLSYHWTVTAAPAAVQPLVVTHADLANPSFSAPVPGNYDLTLAVSDGAHSRNAPISIHARGIGSSTVTATPANGTAIVVGPGGGANIVTTVLDTDGNALAAIPVSVAITAGFTGNTLAPASGSTAGDGTFTALLTSTKAGNTPLTKNGETKTVQASSGPAALGSVNVDFAPGPVNHIEWFVQPCNLPAGGTIQCGSPAPAFPEVDGYDQFGNVNTAYTSPVSLILVQQPANSALTGTIPQNAGTPFNDLSVDKIGTYQILATVPENFPGPTAGTTGPAPSFGVLSNTFQGTQAPPNAPVITSSAANTPRQIVLNWNGSQTNNNKTDKTILQYHVFRAPGALTPPNAAFVEIATPTIAGGVCGGPTTYTPCTYTDTDPALADGTQYTYYVEADNNGVATCDASSCSAPSNVTQQFTVPGAATNVTTSSPAQGTIRVAWSAPATGTASNYDVRRASTLNGTYATVTGGGALTVLTFDNTGLADNTNFFYKVRSRITGATAPATNPATAETAAGVQGTTLAAVPTLTCSNCTGATSNSYNSVSLSWAAPGGNATFAYQIERTTTNLFPQDAFANNDPGFSGATFTNGAAAGNLPVYPGVNAYTYHLSITNAGGTVTSGNLSISTPAAPWVSSSSGLAGGWINAIVPDAFNSIVYAGSGKPTDATTAGGIFKSSTAASAWAPVNNGVPNGRVIAGLAARRDAITGAVLALYAGTGGSGVLGTVDRGMTWNPIGTGLASANVTAVFVDSQLSIWAGTSTGAIFKLPNQTTTWVSTTTPATGAIQAFAEDTATNTVYAQATGGTAASGGLLSINGTSGASWSVTNTGLATTPQDCTATRSNASSLAIDNTQTTPVIYWGSQLCGLLSRPTTAATWSVVAGYTTPEITRLVVEAPNIWVAAAAAGVAFNNGAATFVNLTGGPAAWEPTALAFDGTNLYAGAADGSGIYRSANPTAPAGGSFTSFKTGLSNVSVKFLVNGLDAAHNLLFAAGDQFGVATSTNQGGSWTPQTFTTPVPACATPAALAYNPANSTLFLLCQGVQGVFIGSSAGTAWTFQPCSASLPASPTFGSGITVQPGGARDTLWFTTTNGTAATLWSTDASGANTATNCAAFSPAPPVSVATSIGIDANGALYLGSPGNFPYTFRAGTGAAWTQAASGPKNAVRFFFDTTAAPDNAWAAGQDDGSGLTGGAFSGPINTVAAATTVAWISRNSGALSSSATATGFDGLLTASAPFLFAGTSMTAGQQYANVVRNTGGTWSGSADGIIGGNVPALVLPNATSGVLIGATHVLAATSGAGIFKTTTGGQ